MKKREHNLLYIFGKNVRTRRKFLKLSQEGLAEKAGVSKNTISDIETSQKFARADTLVKLAQVLETEPYELLKPDHIQPDSLKDVVRKISEEVKEAVDVIGNQYSSTGHD
ncbi:MAG: helix-turn-helix domain-containing protein [Treponema sp.]|nr:helix-turn-helix domain-containing protein [Treponema sp.]